MKLRHGTLVILAAAVLAFGCKKKSSTDDSAGGGGGSTTDTFTASGIAKRWQSDCIATTDPTTGLTYYAVDLTLNADGTFSSFQHAHNDSSCFSPTARAYFSVYGTYTISGTGTTRTLLFTINFAGGAAPDIMVTGNAVRTAINSDCGGTSPYGGGANATDGSHQVTGNFNCMNSTYPNFSLRPTFQNVATFSGGVLTIGAPDEANIPGAFVSGGVVATSATIPLH